MATVTCKVCGQVQCMEALLPGMKAECCRCDSVLERRPVNSLARTAALSFAALIFYVPANIYPILRIESYGMYSESTVWEGCEVLFKDGQWFVAVVVFAASIVIPFLKLTGLFVLVTTVKVGSIRWRRNRTRLFRLVELVGPWAMLDVFLLAILVALVKLGQVATVLPGPGIFAFTMVVVLTLFAAASFDSKLIWESAGRTS